MRAWMKIFAALFVVIPFATSAFCADPEVDKPTPESNKKRIEKLESEIAQLRKDVTENSVNTLKMANDQREIKESLRRMEEALKSLAARQDTIVRKAGYDERSMKPAETTTSATATIVLENVYDAAATVRINNQYYRVEPNQTKTILNVPVGTFQYAVEVDGFGSVDGMPRSDRLPAAGYRIRIFPRMSSL
jgi:septal ring factor EnvC (AmiA/AmiB activator)